MHRRPTLSLVILGCLTSGCSDNGPSVTTASLTNTTLPPSNDDDDDDDDDDDSNVGTTTAVPTSTGGSDTGVAPTTAGPVETTTTGPADTTTTGEPPITTGPPITTDTSEDSGPPPAECGDGEVQGDEDCDDGDAINVDECLDTCVFASCGDGFVQAGVEGCDDGNNIDDDACSNTCVAATCGDHVVSPAEQCDDGNNSNTDACLNSCLDASCGDGFVHAGSEACDDGDAQNNDGCDNDCTVSGGQKYTAVGPQTNVPAASVTGWSVCFSNTYEKNTPTVASVLSQCNKQNLMLACRKVGSTTYTLLAHAPRTAVITDTGTSNTPTIANGSGWYFSDIYSWGFAKQGDTINRISCDTEATNPTTRLCFHTIDLSLQGGYRCGASIMLNADTTWERVVLHAD